MGSGMCAAARAVGAFKVVWCAGLCRRLAVRAPNACCGSRFRIGPCPMRFLSRRFIAAAFASDAPAVTAVLVVAALVLLLPPLSLLLGGEGHALHGVEPLMELASVLLGLLVVDQGQTVSGPLLSALLLLNPTDIYRLFNLTGSAGVSAFSGMAGAAGGALNGRLLLATLALWAFVPLTLSALVFSRREL